MQKTYAWINETPISSEHKTDWTKDNIITITGDFKFILFPINVINKCPETIFAIKRILKVKGRIAALINSIKTINLINGRGVPFGTRWENILFVYFAQPYRKNPIHIGNEINILKTICLVTVKELGTSPIKFKKKIKKKILINIKHVLSFSLFKAIDSCIFISWKINFIITVIRDGIEKILIDRKIVERIIIIQFISSIKKKFIDDFGSKDINSLIFVIFIFILFVLLDLKFLNSKNI